MASAYILIVPNVSDKDFRFFFPQRKKLWRNAVGSNVMNIKQMDWVYNKNKIEKYSTKRKAADLHRIARDGMWGVSRRNHQHHWESKPRIEIRKRFLTKTFFFFFVEIQFQKKNNFFPSRSLSHTKKKRRWEQTTIFKHEMTKRQMTYTLNLET